MSEVNGFPYQEVQFDKNGGLSSPDQSEILDFVRDSKLTDLLVISHGWNNDMPEARRLYEKFLESARDEIKNDRQPGLGSRTIGVLAILWPSKRFADSDVIASGAASVGDDDSEISSNLETLRGLFDDPASQAALDRAAALLPSLDSDPNAAAKFADIIRKLTTGGETVDEGSNDFFDLPSQDLLDRLGRADLPSTAGPDSGGAAGFDLSASPDSAAAGFNPFGGVKPAIKKVLNFTTYYEMKKRAGTIGSTGVHDLLRRIRTDHPGLKLHLIGHSFGGRLVTAVAAGPAGGSSLNVNSMSLLQAAFSHHGFAEKFDGSRNGFFRNVLSDKKVAGPIIVTHSIKDTAVGKLYPAASTFLRDDSSGFGDASSRFGGLGRNGAQDTPEADNSQPLGTTAADYTFQSGKLYNLNGDTVITDHSDVTRSEVAHAVMWAIAAS